MKSVGLAVGVLVLVGCASESPDHGESATRAPITGGEVDDGAEAHPAVVFLVAGNMGCTGTLIAPNLVLTARHCVSETITSQSGCDIFGNSLNGDHVGADVAPAAIEVHTGVTPSGPPAAMGAQLFHPPGNILCNADIALLVLNQPVAGTTPQKIRTTAPPLIGELTTAVGYGNTSSSSSDYGTRRRRDDVEILSVGQDLNETNLGNEITASQGQCSGDSGGPIISTGGAVVGVAVRGSNCSDATNHQRYTRLDSHAALIDEAFAAAGATPSLETGTGNAPPKLATGEGPCTTGAQCTSLICTKAATPVCTQFCSETPCPAGTQCQEGSVLKGDGTIVDGNICLPLPKGNACETCRAEQCVNLATTCLSSPDCAALVSCVDACTDAACVAACSDSNSAGAMEYGQLTDCVCNTACSADCVNQCGGAPIAGAGGSGATGGASGNGGSSGGPTKASSSDDSGGCAVGLGRAEHSWLLALAFLVARRKRAANSGR